MTDYSVLIARLRLAAELEADPIKDEAADAILQLRRERDTLAAWKPVTGR